MNEQFLLVLVSILLSIFIIFLGIIIYLLVYKRGYSESRSKLEPTEKRIQESPRADSAILKSKSLDIVPVFCVDHPELLSVGVCMISGEGYCDNCLTKEDDIKIARKYLDFYLDNEWKQIAMFNVEDYTHDMISRIKSIKKGLWIEESIPVLIQGHYKIVIETDEVQQYMILSCMSQHFSDLSSKFSFLKG